MNWTSLGGSRKGNAETLGTDPQTQRTLPRLHPWSHRSYLWCLSSHWPLALKPTCPLSRRPFGLLGCTTCQAEVPTVPLPESEEELMSTPSLKCLPARDAACSLVAQHVREVRLSHICSAHIFNCLIILSRLAASPPA